MMDVTTEMIPFASLAPLRLRVKSRTRGCKERKAQFMPCVRVYIHNQRKVSVPQTTPKCAIVRTSDPARQPRVHATTASTTDPVSPKPTYGLTETALKDALRQIFDADRNESVSSIFGGGRGCAKHWAPLPIATCAALVLTFSVVIEIARFYWSAGVWCDIIETRVTCHDLPGIADRTRKRAPPS